MANKELNEKNTVAGDETGVEEAAGRRSFMKGIVAGSVAVGAMASSVAAGTPGTTSATQSRFSLVAKPRLETAKLKISFDQRHLPKLSEVQRTLEEILSRTGCPNCGLGGIDVILRLDEIINPNDRFAAIVEGEILQN